MNIYSSIARPIISLAPMEDVTDTVFRQIVASVQRPDLFYTEFVNVEGLNSEGRDKVMQRLKYDESEKPIIAQLWGSNPNNFYNAAILVRELGFDGIDINMGCAVKKVSSKNEGIGMINADRGLVEEVIQSVKDGAEEVPVSVKTRLGWSRYDENWIRFLLEQGLDALTIHLRTAVGESAIEADWEKISLCLKLRDKIDKDTLIFGNGDVKSIEQAMEYYREYDVDGVMIGRAAIDAPWIFSEHRKFSDLDRIKLFKKHVFLFKKTWGDTKNFSILKKFIKSYVSDFPNSQEIRERMMNTKSIDDLLQIIDELLS
ncbi:MAG: tRNA-dihydrouridine synthase [Caldisericia bacterium]|nr:tRNA-dihydrouridine synthase [Caldisericia bacterium]